MSAPSNTARQKEVDDSDESDFGPDLLSDPSFIPCRVESCGRKELHREHGATPLGRRTHQTYDHCPNCRTPVVVTKANRKTSYGKSKRNRTRVVIIAECMTCGWTHTKALKKD
jgi:hypothetical protein